MIFFQTDRLPKSGMKITQRLFDGLDVIDFDQHGKEVCMISGRYLWEPKGLVISFLRKNKFSTFLPSELKNLECLY